MITVEEISRIWSANEELWEKKLLPTLLIPLEEKGGVDTKSPWHKIVATAFARSLQTFEAIQTLCVSDRPRKLWTDAYILSRTHYETFITLEWVALSPETRWELFPDEFQIKFAHMLEMLGDMKEQVAPNRRKEIMEAADEVRKRRSMPSDKLRLIPGLQEMVRELSEPLRDVYPNLAWEYDTYYRDVSGFAHPTGWGIVLSISNPGDPVEDAVPRLETGYNAVLNNGGWFFRILDRWNKTFQIMERVTLEQWHREWEEKVKLGS